MKCPYLLLIGVDRIILMLDFEPLAKVGLTQYERRTLITILKLGVANATSLCSEGDIPTSKIYSATERLESLGLIQIQRSRPRQFAAMSPEAVIERIGTLARENAEHIASESQSLLKFIQTVQGNSRAISGFADVALGQEAHFRRHITLLASARQSIVSYLELPDIEAINQYGSNAKKILQSIRKNSEANKIEHRIVFGFGPRDAQTLIQFLKDFRQELRYATGIRYAGLLGHPFHIVDNETVILSLDNPFLPERRFGSVMMRSGELATPMTHGFNELWNKSMKSLQEISVDPRTFQPR